MPCKGTQTFPNGVTTSVKHLPDALPDGTEMSDGYFLKRRCRLWQITPDSQRLTNRTAHLACFKPGQMCIILTQHTDIQRYLHHHCTSTSKTIRHEPYSRAVMAVAGMSSREKANIFLPRSFSEAPMCQTSVLSIIRKRS